MKNISLKLPDDLHARLARAAKDRNAAKSQIVREALETYFANGKKGRRASIAELAADLIGCVDGPADLATNPKYMEGFGR
jgi:predicted transcriptional regulator